MSTRQRLIILTTTSVLLLCGSGQIWAAEQSDADIWKAAAEGDLKVLTGHIAAGADLNAKAPGYDLTPLMAAAITGQGDAAALLLKKGAKPDIENNEGTTALHMAAFFGHIDIVKALLAAGADTTINNIRSETPFDVVKGEWDKGLESLYRAIEEGLQLELDLDAIKAARPQVAGLLAKHNKGASAKTQPTAYRGSYYMNGEIHVNKYGTPEGKPLTSGHWDFKPSWSKTGEMLVFFRRLKNDRVVTNWKTAIYVINVDGTGLHPLSEGTHTDFNQTWTRDGTNTPIWNRKIPKNGGFQVMASKVGAKPGDEFPLTGKGYHTWAYTCLIDGRILVQCAHPTQGRGYYLLTPNPGGKPEFERINCELAIKGKLDRVSLSPSETRVCFEYQLGFKNKVPGRTLYIADFDAKKPAITNAKPFANEEGADRWFAYPRWSKDEKVIVYHASPSLYIYDVDKGTTVQVSTQESADYRYPHMEATPK